LLALGVPGVETVPVRREREVLLRPTLQVVSSACLSGVACELVSPEVSAVLTESRGRS
jgi:hypothetical protein